MWLREFGSITDIEKKQAYSPVQLELMISKRMNQMTDMGMLAGQRFILSYGNNAHFFTDLIAGWRLACCAVPIDPQSSWLELENIIESSQANFIITNGNNDGLKRTNNLTHSLELASQSDFEALLLYTSGTTGAPKGVSLSAALIEKKIKLLTTLADSHQVNRTLCLLPTCFGHGLICNSLFPWLTGHGLYIAPPGNAKVLANLAQIIDEYQISFFSSVPALWNLISKSPKPLGGSLLKVHCASSPLDKLTWKKIRTWCGEIEIKNVYGMTEFGGWLAAKPDGSKTEESGFVGQGLGVKFKVTNAKGEALSPGKVGEIHISSNLFMTGYFSNGLIFDPRDSQGWFKTGDLGYIDFQEHLYISGRLTSVINKSGIKIYPEEIETLIMATPEVEDACVFPIEHPITGEEVAVAIVLKSIYSKTQIASIKNLVSSKISPLKIPTKWFLVESIPRNQRGKLNRKLIANKLVKTNIASL